MERNKNKFKQFISGIVTTIIASLIVGIFAMMRKMYNTVIYTYPINENNQNINMSNIKKSFDIYKIEEAEKNKQLNRRTDAIIENVNKKYDVIIKNLITIQNKMKMPISWDDYIKKTHNSNGL